MQQAYRALRIVSEAQTIRIILAPDPGELMLKELCTACASLNTESSNGIKAVVLDFNDLGTQFNAPSDADALRIISSSSNSSNSKNLKHVPPIVEETVAAVHATTQPVLAVVRKTLSPAASMLIQGADLTLVAHDATLTIENPESGDETLNGVQAARLGYISWTAPANDITKEMEHILDMLREKSAVALRHTKASIRLGQTNHSTHLEALKQVNTFYLAQLMQTEDASEGLHAFLEKRKPNWKNR